MRRKTTKDALELISRDVGIDPTFHQRVEEEKLNAQVARLILDARTEAGLTQKRLAELVGTTQPVIARLEDADYEGHSLGMLRRIAEALEKQLQVRFVANRRVVRREMRGSLVARRRAASRRASR